MVKEFDSFKQLAVEMWDEFGAKTLIIIGVCIVLFIGGGTYRLSKGGSFWNPLPESAEDRRMRMAQCAQARKDNPSYAQRMSSGESADCSGFTNEEIEGLQEELGL